MFGMMEAMLSFLRRQIGLRTDAADPAGSLHAKTSGIWQTAGRASLKAIGSDTLQFSADTERSTTSNTSTKLKEIIVAVGGVVRVSFDLKHSTGSSTFSYAQIYRNGVPWGTQRQTDSTSYITYTEDIYVNKGDLIQLYAWGDTCWVRNFRIKWSDSFEPYLGMVVQN